MINKKDLFVRVIDQAPDMKYRVEYTSDGDMITHQKTENEWKDNTVMQGGITINGQLRKFYMSLNVWNEADYVQQWEDGLERLERYNQSCLVINVDNEKMSLVKWWILYRVERKVFMQFHISCDFPYDQAIMNGLFTPETCYDFIPPRQTHDEDGEEIYEIVLGKRHYLGIDEQSLLLNRGIKIGIIDYEDGDDSAFGQLVIGNDFYETFEIGVACCWSLEEYIAQWEEGLNRLRIHGRSCLVISASDSDCGHFINWWLFYKKNGLVYAQNQILVEQTYEEIIGKKLFTPETCYDFIPEPDIAIDESERISELFVSYSDLFL